MMIIEPNEQMLRSPLRLPWFFPVILLVFFSVACLCLFLMCLFFDLVVTAVRSCICSRLALLMVRNINHVVYLLFFPPGSGD